MSQQEKQARGTASHYVRVSAWTAQELSNLYHECVKQAESFGELRIRCRGDHDWIGVAKKIGDDGGPLVLFGTGTDFVSVLLALNASMARHAWKPDKPWKPGG